MKLGAENKKSVYALVAIGGLSVYMLYSNLLSGPDASSRPVPSIAHAPKTPATQSETTPVRTPSNHSDEFKPALHTKHPEDRVDVTQVDPALRIDLLDKLAAVPAPSGRHNLFEVGAPEPFVPVGRGSGIIKVIAWNHFPPQPQYPIVDPPTPPLNIGLVYHGWAAPSGTEKRRAFFLDGDDTIVKFEGDTLKGHFRLIRIGPDTCVVEDTNDKRRQTLTKAKDAVL